MSAEDEPLGMVITTVGDQETAQRIGMALLNARLAACVHYEAIRSQYIWEDKVCTDEEVRLTIKTLRRHYHAVQAQITALHHYDCPQIIWLDIDGGSAGYLQWARQVMA